MAIPDATDDDSEVIGHGSGIGAGLRDALVSHGIGVFVSNNRDFLQAAKEADGLGYDYVLKAVPIDWEDNATEWSGNPDRAGISIELYEVTSKQLAATSTYRMTASSNALRSVNPERFVPELADVGLSKIFGWQPQPWDSPGYRNKVLR